MEIGNTPHNKAQTRAENDLTEVNSSGDNNTYTHGFECSCTPWPSQAALLVKESSASAEDFKLVVEQGPHDHAKERTVIHQ